MSLFLEFITSFWTVVSVDHKSIFYSTLGADDAPFEYGVRVRHRLSRPRTHNCSFSMLIFYLPRILVMSHQIIRDHYINFSAETPAECRFSRILSFPEKFSHHLKERDE
jgi:hypothetical protein